uniref:Uncharacterized protein n=1 Tax=Culex tarsalis TaxID=7177 RepID=A0A1Q3FW32_CULTA
MLEEELTEIMTAVDPEKAMYKVVERALRNETEQLLGNLKKANKQPEPVLMKMFEMARLVQISQEAEQAQAKVPLAQFDHSYSVLTEIKTTIITVGIAEDATSTSTVRDQYGVPWLFRLRKDMEWLIADIDTSKCRGVMGRFKVLVRFHHESPLRNYSRSVEIEVSRIRTIYCGTLCSVSQLREDGYFAADGTLTLRVAIVPMDEDAERSTLMSGKRLKQIPADHNANRMPKFTEGQLTIPDFLNSRTTQSQPLLDANRTSWQLEVRLNQGANERERMHMAISIGQCDGSAAAPPDICHEYFVELLTVDANGWTLRKSGRMLKGSVSMPDFLLKSRAEIYLKDGKLRLRWGIRRIPIR